MKMSDFFENGVFLCVDTIEDDNGCYATTSCEYLVGGIDAGEAICHAINNHDKLVEALQLSTDRLDAIWANTGSMGAKSQADINKSILADLEK